MFTLAIQGQVSQAERQALIDFYIATDGDNWTNNTNWDTDINSTSDVSTWYGVSVASIAGQKYVNSLTLSDNNLVGELPNLSKLVELKSLNFINNNLRGTINVDFLPPRASSILFDDNQFSGNIPDFSNKSRIVYLRLGNNHFTGSVNSSLFNKNINSVWLNNNDISGELDFSEFDGFNAININNTNINFLKLPHSLDGDDDGSFRAKNTPKLAYVEVGSNHFNDLRYSNFDVGLRIVSYNQADKTVIPNAGDREAILRFDNNIKTFKDAKSFGLENINGEVRITQINLSNYTFANNALPTEVGLLTELKSLNLFQCKLNSIPNEFGNLVKVESVYLNNNSITSLPSEIGNLTNLKDFRVNNNSITILPENFYNLSNLEIFEINNNPLLTFSTGLGNLFNLLTLKFNNTQVDLIPNTIGNLKKLVILEFSKTKISLLPPQIGGLTALTRLVAAPNNIASIPSEFGQLTKLTYLDFANCELSNTPAAFANLTQLETLFLNDNELQVVAGLGGFTQLKQLRLHNNRLGEDNPNFNTDLPEDMSDLVLLEELTLYSNQLTKLPTNIGNLNKLTKLHLQQNNLESLPTTIGNLTNLIELKLEGNKLTSLPTTIGGLTSLEKLYLSQSSSNNKITSLPDEIGDLSNLKELYVENMRSYDTTTGVYTYTLTSLPTTMNKMLNLEALEASNSGIEGLVDLTKLTKLKRIQLNNNKITDLKIDAPVSNFSVSSAGYHFNLTQNPFITCIEVPTSEVTKWEARYAQVPQIADNGIAFSDNCTGFRVPQSERDALVAFYVATKGGDKVDATTGITWVGANWSTDATELTNVGSWQGVTTEIINGQKHVTKLELTNKRLSGNVPKEIKDLSELTILNLSGNRLKSIPTEIGDLSKLTYLNLSNNNIESLPTGIGNFVSLLELHITNQKKDGLSSSNYVRPLTSLPDEIGDISTLEKLDLSYNGLTSLPSGIGNFSNLKELKITYQETKPEGVLTRTLTSLPDEIGNITSLEKLYLNNNGLTSLPTTINGLSGLQELHLHANELTVLPTTIGGLTSLEKLYLSQSSSNNKITSLPDEIGDLSNLKELYVENMRSYDTTTGVYTYTLTSLPTTMNKMLNLEALEASNSGIEGLVDLTKLTKLKRIQLNNNKITDLKIDAPVSNFSVSSAGYHFNLTQNPFITCIEVPTSEVTKWEARYAQVPQIADNGIAFSDNCTGFRVPQSERDALVAFYVATKGGDKVDATTGITWVGANWSTDATELTNVGSWQGVTTEIINGQKHVTKLELTNKRLSGNVPKEIKDLSELTILNLSGNRLKSIPTEIGDLSKLTYLNLSNNNIESLPTGIGNFVSLLELHITNQKKDGLSSSNYVRPLTSLPDEIGDISTLEKLDLSYNGLTSLPSGIGNFSNLKELKITYQETKPEGVLTRTLTSLPDEIGNITSLEKLYLNNNGLTSLPTTINGLSGLQELHLHANELTVLPTTIGGLTSLEKLYLSQSSSNNKITSLPDEIGDLSNLKELYVENMRSYDTTTGVYTYTLTSLPTTMNKMLNLEALEASNSGIEGLVDLTKLTKLKRIQLNNNKITDLKIDAPVSNFSVSSAGYHFNLTQNPFITCVEVPTSEVTKWEARYAQVPQIADNGIAFSDNCTGFRVPQSERDALVAFYVATKGGDKVDATTGITWVGANWSTDATELTNVGSWQGVTTEIINGQKHVTKLELTNKRLSGNVPKEIKDLSELTILNLSGNSLESIPTEIGDLGKLVYLNLSSNSLESLPTGIGNFASLMELQITNQKKDVRTSQYTSTLTSLPDEIGNIATLEKLNLSYNGLTSLPSGIGNFTNLKELNISYQKTSPVRYKPEYTLASLPDEIGNITSLEKLELQYNNLESLPTTITSLINLENLNVRNNRISGSLDLSNSEVLKDFRVDYNNISELKIAVSPTIFGITDRSSRFYAKRNALGCIEVPNDELVAWQLSEATEERNIIDNGVVYSDNCSSVTTNSIPDLERDALVAIYNKTKGTDWKNDLSSSYGVPWETDNSLKRNVGAWHGVTTAIINGQKHVTKIELNSNDLDGKIPSEIKNLPQLQELEINSNAISEIPAEIGELANLEQLTFTSQYSSAKAEYVLKGIPSEINNIISLKRLELSSNQLEGNLDFSNLVNLTSLIVSSNQITGLKIGVSPNVFDNGSQDGYSNRFSFSNQYLNCIAVPDNTITDWESSSFATSNPNIVWGQDCSAYNNVPEDEMQALVDIYNNLDGANWTNSENWTGNLAKALISNPYNATKWRGITTKIVDGGKHITDVSLSSNKLKGEIPESFGNLSKLINVQLSSNDISGALPSSIGNLISLETLYLNNNKIESLPVEMTRMLKLKTIYLQNNEIMGKVPDFTEASTLERLYISSNKFQFGDFEDEFTTYQNLKTFSYTSQEKVGEEENVDFGDGFDKTLEAVVSGTNNTYQWYKNGGKITDAIDKQYVITDATHQDAGYYYCKVSNSIVTSLTIETERVTLNYDAALSVNDVNFLKSIKLYPNPVTNTLKISNINKDKVISIEIYNVLGKKIHVVNKPLKSIDVSYLAKGIYLVNIITDKGKAIKRLVKN